MIAYINFISLRIKANNRQQETESTLRSKPKITYTILKATRDHFTAWVGQPASTGSRYATPDCLRDMEIIVDIANKPMNIPTFRSNNFLSAGIRNALIAVVRWNSW